MEKLKHFLKAFIFAWFVALALYILVGCAAVPEEEYYEPDVSYESGTDEEWVEPEALEILEKELGDGIVLECVLYYSDIVSCNWDGVNRLRGLR